MTAGGELPAKTEGTGSADLDFHDVVEALSASPDGFTRRRSLSACQCPLPSLDALNRIIDDLRAILFPGYFDWSDLTEETLRFHIGATLDGVIRGLREQIARGLCFSRSHERHDCRSSDAEATDLTRRFIERLPTVRHLLASDVQAAYEGDPAATSPDETIFCYPGVLAVTNQRLAHELYRLGVPLIPRIITEHAHSITGIDIHPGAAIGERFFIDHGTGVVIGETTIIGRNVRLYQGVTLGAKSFPLDANGQPIKGIPRHPILEDDVVVYAGATILGRITIGKGSTIGGNVWVTRSMPPNSRIAQAQQREEASTASPGE